MSWKSMSAVGAVALLCAVVMPAVGAASGQPPLVISVGPAGHLTNDGLTVHVPVTVTCSMESVSASSVALELRQARDGWIASGYGTVSGALACTGRPELVTVTVEAIGPGPTLAGGESFATTYVDVEGQNAGAPASQADRLSDQVVDLASVVAY